MSKLTREEISEATTNYKTVFGFRMFIVYGLVYAGFVIVNVAKPRIMEKIVFQGMNLAVTYGFGLIVLAIVLALFYHCFCVKREKSSLVAENEAAEKGEADHE